jgi:hypothetical protein
MPEDEKIKRWRSPNYPFISIKKALDYVQILYDKHSRYSVALPVIAQDWHLKGSYLAQHIAALASYGFIEIEGEGDARKIKMSDTALKIVLDNRPGSKERDDLIRIAALSPHIFNKIYNAYQPKWPADHNLEYELVQQYRFNPASVKDFIAVFKETMDFTGLYKSGTMEEQNNATEVPDMLNADKSLVAPPKWGMGFPSPSPSPSPSPAPPPCSDAREREIANYPIGRNLNARIIISGSSPVTTDSIKKLMALLDLNKEDLHEIIPNEKCDPTEN